LPAAARRSHAQQSAQIHEMRLRTLAFVQAGSRAACAPFGVEVCEVHEWVDISGDLGFLKTMINGKFKY
jgi:hypothetical protein